MGTARSRKNASVPLGNASADDARDASTTSRGESTSDSCRTHPLAVQEEGKGNEMAGSLWTYRKNRFLHVSPLTFIQKINTKKPPLREGVARILLLLLLPSALLLVLELLGALSSRCHASPASEDWSAAHALSAEPFELYEDFDIKESINGDEGWWDLIGYRRDIDSPKLAFYVDKVAQKRWLPSLGVSIPKPFVLKYKSELAASISASQEDEANAIFDLLPDMTSYAAKPSHTSCSDGVWLVKYDKGSDGKNSSTFIGKGGGKIKKDIGGDAASHVAEKLAEYLHEKPRSMESTALKLVKPGVVVEERFTLWDSDHAPAFEFKVFVIWGRVLFAQWRRGDQLQGLVRRNGTVVDWYWKRKKNAASAIPTWVDWAHIIDIAERFGAHKDMFRVDMFVGIPSGLFALQDEPTEHELKAAVQIVVSEFEVHPTSERVDKSLFEEAARLWIAGYKTGNYWLVSNTEVPPSFVDNGLLAPANVLQLRSGDV